MEEHCHEFEIELMCSVLSVSRSGYYSWRQRKPSRRSTEDQRLGARIIKSHAESGETYGSPRVLRDLKDEGERISRKRVARLMRQNKLFSKHRRKYRLTTNSDHKFPVARNLLERNFDAEYPDQKWVTDITYIPTAEGWLYLAVVIDLFSRRVVGWSMSSRLERELAIEALKMALGGRKPESGLVHHSDRGSQYASNEYRELLQAEQILVSMSRSGNCWDNAVAESFFKTLKVERTNDRRYQTRQEATVDVFQYIEVFYNRKRRHSAIEYFSPVDFEALRVAA